MTRVILRLSDDGLHTPMVVLTILADSAKRHTTKGKKSGVVDVNAIRLCQSFVYDENMEQWCRVADHHYSRSDYTSGFGNNLRLSSGGSSAVGGMHPLDSLQATGHDIGSVTSGTTTSDLYEWGDTTQQWYETRAHLEHQMSASATLKSPVEFSQWTIIYCKFLARDGRESSVQRLREVCNDLLGPPLREVPEHVWKSDVMGMDKRTMLRQRVLPAIATNRGLQRIVNEYQDALGMLVS